MNREELKNGGFTLIELLVVIAIIGLLSTLSVVALNSAREKARNARRVSDIKQVQTALELYYNDNNTYPPTIEFGTGSIATNSVVYMTSIPANPQPRTDGSCADSEYVYVRDDYNTYHITYCLSNSTGGIDAGTNNATPAGISE